VSAFSPIEQPILNLLSGWRCRHNKIIAPLAVTMLGFTDMTWTWMLHVNLLFISKRHCGVIGSNLVIGF